jgi:6-phosphogluconate dehydrogenase
LLKYKIRKEGFMMKYDIAVVGMAVMGKNLALNIADHGFKTVIYNRTTEVTDLVIKENPHENLIAAHRLEEMVAL